MELVLNMAVPIDDVDIVKQKAKELLGELSVAPMAGSEIAIVSPTLARHHLPHAACDISEYLRRYGAKDNMVGLARGHGKGDVTCSMRKVMPCKGWGNNSYFRTSHRCNREFT